MKAIRIASATALLFACTPAFAHGGGGGGMGGMGHGSGISTNAQNQSMHDTQTQSLQSKFTVNGKTMTKSNIFNKIELHIVFEEDLRVEKELLKLINEGLGNSPKALALKAQDIKLANELRKLGFTGS